MALPEAVCGVALGSPLRSQSDLDRSCEVRDTRNMANKLTVTSSRWDELTALLRDEQRLRSEYPKVAEYLDVAAGLAGSGDDQADGGTG